MSYDNEQFRGARSADEGDVRQVLAGHFVMWVELTAKVGPRGEWRCTCGLKFGFSDSALDHVADQVQAALRHSEAEKGRLWQHLRDRCARAETMHAEAFRIGIAKQEQLAAVEALMAQAERETAQANTTPDPLTGRHSTLAPYLLTRDIRAAMSLPPGTEVS